jgi:hypothetical protein
MIIVGVLFYIIATWILGVKTPEPFVEGFANTNPQYTYLPNSSSPNLFIKFGLADLAVDISGACDFIKLDSALNSVKNITAAATTSSPSPSPYSGNTAAKIESFSTEPEPTTSPASSVATPQQTTVPIATTTSITDSGNTTATSSSVYLNSTTAPTATTEPSFDTETQNDTEPPTATTEPSITTAPPIATTESITATEPPKNGEYTVPYTELDIYKIYSSTTGSYNNQNIFKLMDASYGNLFDTTKIGNLSDANIAKMWEANVSISIDDALYNGANYFVIQSQKNSRKCSLTKKESPGLSSYFLLLIQKNKSRSSVLLSLKNAYYSVIKPRFLMNMLSNIYWQNAKSFTNADKGTQNSVIYVLNTYANLAKTNTLEADLSANEVAKIISDETPFTFDALWLYQMTSIAFELHRFSAYFQTNGSITSGNKTPAITTTLDKFISGYSQYLQKINQVEPNSPLIFLLRYLPSNADCPIASKLTPYVNNIYY